ncbi:endonuclease/exonuclease/phosphatase family protein [Selenomonas ruminantium]|uniref:Endonuclease/Exonuclease/phosphatase family protein n=1 Tax=Selenomonas ruminantium TaxID=971 RepID=A0A1K1M6D4_SELRU|nr:endonuclease/exonuclease/phosphatase family protein [Selenomonas ruminantium]SFW18738.1 Endonuclease/Exonuclease/phosphatase family protein [Selenomonas ruminantium]
MMKIATWNVERLKHQSSLDKIISVIEAVQADIIVLTETDERIKPNYRYSFHTPKLRDAPADYRMPGCYKDYAVADVHEATENRVSIYTNYPCVSQHKTYDKYTALCIELETDAGKLLVYGTIIGIIGNRDESFKQDLLQQVGDFERLSKWGDICVCGDFNCSFADNYYFTNFGRETLRESFMRNKIALLTGSRQECIDHIAISRNFIGAGDITVSEWNLDKSLSDHKGIVAEIKLNSDTRAKL